LGIARPEISGFEIIQFWGRRTPGFRGPSSASAEGSGDGQGKKPPFKGNIPKNEIPHIQFSRECQELGATSNQL